jgi:hypothetical protein
MGILRYRKWRIGQSGNVPRSHEQGLAARLADGFLPTRTTEILLTLKS